MPDNKLEARPKPSVAPPILTFYTVLHGAVGPHVQGSVITSADLNGVNVQRLLDLGAIVETAAPVEVAPVADAPVADAPVAP